MVEEKEETEQKTAKKSKKKLTKVEKWFRTMRRWYAFMGRFFIPVKKLGHVEKFNDRAYVYVGNHLSVLDVVPVAISLDKPVHFMSKNELTKKRLGRWFTSICECIMVNRDGTDVRALMQAMKYLKNGESVCVFPEGTRNKTNEIFLPFKGGAAALAIKTKTPIVLMIQRYKIRLFRKNYVFYSDPFELSEYYDKRLTEVDIKEADEKLRERMLAIYLELDEKLNKKKQKKQ